MRKIIFIILIMLSGRCFGQTFSTNQVRQIQALMKPNDDWVAGQITWLRAGKTADSMRINSLEKRVKALEDSAFKYRNLLLFDTAVFKIVKVNNVDVLTLKNIK